MEKTYLLGFDAGTGESKGTICDINGEVVATAFKPHALRVPKPGFAEHDPIEDWWNDFKYIVRALLDKSGIKSSSIAGIGISTIMAGIVPVDERCNPLRNAILYGIDTRAQKQVADIAREIGEETMLRECGAVVNQESFGPKIRWIHDNEPSVYAKAARYTIAPGFINAKLTGRYCVDAYSIGSALPMYDRIHNTWHPQLTQNICRVDQLPEIRNTTDIIGHVTAEAAEETGLTAGTPVIAGTTDAGAEAVSVGVVEAGDTMLMYGSTMFLVSVMNSEALAGNAWSHAYTIKGNACLTSGMATTGSLIKWLRDQFGRDLTEAEKNGGINAYAAMEKEAEGIAPGADGLLLLPYFLGERMPIMDPNAKGVLFGLNLRHTRGHIIKAAYEGIGYGLDQNLEMIRSMGQRAERVTSVGGGTRAKTWLQTISDVCGITQIVPEITIGASYGDALLAGIGIGALTPADVKRAIKVADVIEPRDDCREIYQERKKQFAMLYTRNADIMHDLR